MPPTIVSLPFNFRPEAAVSGALLVQTERTAFLAFNTMEEREGRMVEAGKTLLVFGRCWICQFGYPNDEASGADVLAPGIEQFCGICEVRDSAWIAQLSAANEAVRPGSSWFAGARHFVVPFHDATFHCIGASLSVNVRNATFEMVWQEIRTFVLEE